MRAAVVSILLVGSLAACGGHTTVDPFGDGGGGTAGSGAGTTSATTTTTSGVGGAGGARLDSCSGPGQCVMASETCCGVCGMPTLDDMVAIHGEKVDEHFAEVCAEPVACPDCPTAPNPDLFAYCENDRCVGADFSTHPANQCVGSTDCRLRWGLGCCECGAQGMGLTAVPQAFVPQLEELVCPPDMGCPECLPAYPADATAVCDVGKCTVVYIDSPSS